MVVDGVRDGFGCWPNARRLVQDDPNSLHHIYIIIIIAIDTFVY